MAVPSAPVTTVTGPCDPVDGVPPLTDRVLSAVSVVPLKSSRIEAADTDTAEAV